MACLMLSAGVLSGLFAVSPSALAAPAAITVSDVTLVPGAAQTWQRVTFSQLSSNTDQFDVLVPQVVGGYIQAVFLSTNNIPCDQTQVAQRWHCPSVAGADRIALVWQTSSIPDFNYPLLTGQRFAVTVTNTATGDQGTGYVSVQPQADLVLESIVPHWDGSTPMISVSVFDRGPSPSSAATLAMTITGSYDPASMPGNCTRSSARITCSVDHRPGAQSLVEIPLAADTGQISITATVTGPQFDPDTTNNQLTVGPWDLFGSGPGNPGPTPGTGAASTGNARPRPPTGTSGTAVPDPGGSTSGAAPASASPANSSDAPTPAPASPRVLAMRAAHSGSGAAWTIGLTVAPAAALIVAGLLLRRRYTASRPSAGSSN